jgi:hypothetical protein
MGYSVVFPGFEGHNVIPSNKRVCAGIVQIGKTPSNPEYTRDQGCQSGIRNSSQIFQPAITENGLQHDSGVLDQSVFEITPLTPTATSSC